mmetsp:Transcript_286/g.801  ORF Transcript_286/g.801 Transcript_286/m.801 type:complete len:272 (-) Transcript_286:126-941(-)
MKVYKRKKDGRRAYLAAYNHFLGPKNIDHMASSVEKKLASISYYGEKKNWNFEKYDTEHKRKHNILKGLVENGYTGIDPRSKVWYLNNGIKTNNLDSVKTRIMSKAKLSTDFDGCVTLFNDFVKANASAYDKQTLGIADVVTDGRDIAIEDKYYDKEAWWSLSKEEHAQVINLRGKQLDKGGGGGDNSSGGGNNGYYRITNYLMRQVAKLQARTANQKRHLESLNAKVAGDSDAASKSGSDDDTSQATGNRNHLALALQKKNKRKKNGKGN